MGVMVMEAGIAGAISFTLLSLNALNTLVPQPLYARTFMLSVVSAAESDVYFKRMAEEILILPESTVTPGIPPNEVGIVQA